MRKNDLSKIIYSAFNQFIKNRTDIIEDELNQIIRFYGADKRLKVNDIEGVPEKTYAIKMEIDKMIQNISEICTKNTTDIIRSILWKVLGLFLFGIFAVIYYAIKGLINISTSETKKRKRMIDKVCKEEKKIIFNIKLNLTKKTIR